MTNKLAILSKSRFMSNPTVVVTTNRLIATSTCDTLHETPRKKQHKRGRDDHLRPKLVNNWLNLAKSAANGRAAFAHSRRFVFIFFTISR